MPTNAMTHLSKQAEQMIMSHRLIDEAIDTQLKSVIFDTENAGMQLIMQTQQLCDAAKAIEAMLNQQQSATDMSQVLTVVAGYNAYLRAGLGEMLGLIQFQDVVRQRIERIERTVTKRNLLFEAFARNIATPDEGLGELPGQMHAVLDEYLSNENRHAPCLDDGYDNASGQDNGVPPKSELF